MTSDDDDDWTYLWMYFIGFCTGVMAASITRTENKQEFKKLHKLFLSYVWVITQLVPNQSHGLFVVLS